MANNYEQYGQSMAEAIGYGGEAAHTWELDQIQQMYDIKRKRLEKLFSTLGHGIEAASRVGDIYSRNKRLSAFAKSQGYEYDSGFLGLGKGRFYKPEKDIGYEVDESGKRIGSKFYKTPREEVSAFDVFGIKNPDFSNLWGD